MRLQEAICGGAQHCACGGRLPRKVRFCETKPEGIGRPALRETSMGVAAAGSHPQAGRLLHGLALARLVLPGGLTGRLRTPLAHAALGAHRCNRRTDSSRAAARADGFCGLRVPGSSVLGWALLGAGGGMARGGAAGVGEGMEAYPGGSYSFRSTSLVGWGWGDAGVAGKWFMWNRLLEAGSLDLGGNGQCGCGVSGVVRDGDEGGKSRERFRRSSVRIGVGWRDSDMDVRYEALSLSLSLSL